MAHIQLPEGLLGIIGPMTAYPNSAKPLNLLAETLLCRGTDGFSKAERETVASYVSYLNDCIFCSESHGAVADVHWQRPGMARKIWSNVEAAPISDRLKSYLKLAAKVQKSGRAVQGEDIDEVRKLGATDEDIHDVILIAAAFCLYNRYVDGLATMAPPRGDAAYVKIGEGLAASGYINAIK